MQVGNGMHLHAIGAVLLVMILKLRVGMADDDASLIDNESERKGRKRVDANGGHHCGGHHRCFVQAEGCQGSLWGHASFSFFLAHLEQLARAA